MVERDIRRMLESGFPGFPGTVILGERMQIRKGLYCGIRFDFETGSAIWRVGEREVVFVDETGRVQKRVLVESEAEPLTRVA